MDLTDVLDRRGGLATRAELIAVTSRADVDAALRHGSLRAVGRGRYASAQVADQAAVAHGMSGVLCLTNAALHHGWEVKTVPPKPHVLVPRKRRVAPELRTRAVPHWADLAPDDVCEGIATGRELTLLQCLRTLPEDEALCIADSALRAGELAALRRIHATVTGPGAAKVRRIALAASPEAANPFESCMRAITLTIPGLDMVPQRVVSSPHVWAQPDLVGVRHPLVIECKSFEWHAKRAGFRKDVRRYTLLTADGWIVLRFIWEDVMHRPGWVRELIIRTLEVAGQAQPRSGRPLAA